MTECKEKQDKEYIIEEYLPHTLHNFLSNTDASMFLGVQFHVHEVMGDNKNILELKPGFIRQDFAWDVLETTDGIDWKHLDNTFDIAKRTGSTVILSVNYWNSKLYKAFPWRNQECLNHLLKTLQQCVIRYGDCKIIWEIWNEPNHPTFWPPNGATAKEYSKFGMDVIKGIRSVDPFACIIGPALAGIDKEWLRDFTKTEMRDHINGLSIHPYRGVDRPPETVILDIKKVYRIVNKDRDGTNIPIIIGEWGYSIEYIEQACMNLERILLVPFWTHVPAVIFYQWKHDIEGDSMPGLLDHNNERTDLYKVFSTMMKMINNSTHVGSSFSNGIMITIFEFEDNGTTKTLTIYSPDIRSGEDNWLIETEPTERYYSANGEHICNGSDMQQLILGQDIIYGIKENSDGQ
jgi:hypothetical protein